MIGAGPKGFGQKPEIRWPHVDSYPKDSNPTLLEKYAACLRWYISKPNFFSGHGFYQLLYDGTKYYEIDMERPFRMGWMAIMELESALADVQWSHDGIRWYRGLKYTLESNLDLGVYGSNHSDQYGDALIFEQPTPEARYWRVEMTSNLVTTTRYLAMFAREYEQNSGDEMLYNVDEYNNRVMTPLVGRTHVNRGMVHDYELDLGGQPDAVILGNTCWNDSEAQQRIIPTDVHSLRRRAASTDWTEKFLITRLTRKGIGLPRNMFADTSWTASAGRDNYHPNAYYQSSAGANAYTTRGFAAAFRHDPSKGISVLKARAGTTSTAHQLNGTPDLVIFESGKVLHKDWATYMIDSTDQNGANPTRVASGYDVNGTNVTHPSLAADETIICINQNLDAYVKVDFYTGGDPQETHEFVLGLVIHWRCSATAPPAGAGGGWVSYRDQNASWYPNSAFLHQDDRGYPYAPTTRYSHYFFGDGRISYQGYANEAGVKYVYLMMGTGE